MEEGRTDRAAPAHDPLLIGAQRMDLLARLAPGIAHELANPFASIMAFSTLIGTDTRLPEDVREDASAVKREGEIAHARTRALLDFARQRPPERHPTRVAPLVQAALDLLSYAMTSKAIRVETSFDDELPPVPIDRAMVQQALLNLLLNAFDSLDAQGGGVVSIRAEGGNRPLAIVRLVIEDDGPGVEPDAVGRIFDAGFTTRGVDRLGLGLTVARAVALDHGGTIEHRPRTDGPGAAFVLELPLGTAGGAETAAAAGNGAAAATPAPAANGEAAGSEVAGGNGAAPGTPAPASNPAPAAPGPTTSARPVVLVVDDELPLRRFLSRALDGIGVDVVEAETAREAADAVRSGGGDGGRVDLVLSDLRMPGADGREVYESLVALRPELADRFVLMSGDVYDPSLRGFAASRGIRLLSKPFDLAEIRATVRSMLEDGRAG